MMKSQKNLRRKLQERKKKEKRKNRQTIQNINKKKPFLKIMRVILIFFYLMNCQIMNKLEIIKIYRRNYNKSLIRGPKRKLENS